MPPLISAVTLRGQCQSPYFIVGATEARDAWCTRCTSHHSEGGRQAESQESRPTRPRGAWIWRGPRRAAMEPCDLRGSEAAASGERSCPRTPLAHGGALGTLTGSPCPWWLPALEGCPQDDASEVSARDGQPAHPVTACPSPGSEGMWAVEMLGSLVSGFGGGGRHLCSFQTDLGSRYKLFRVSSPHFASCRK